jgi:short-subunit dehydrogenase
MNIVITGTSQGLGLALASALYEQGHTVIGLSRREIVQPWETCQCDIRNLGDVCGVINYLYKVHGYIDVLINNAGKVLSKKMSDYKLTEVHEILDVNIMGTFLMSQHLSECMAKQGGGYIINIGSTRSITSAPNKSLYAMSKFAVRALTQSINTEYNSRGVYSTLVCPGQIDDNDITKVQTQEVIKTVNYLLSMPITAKVPEIIIGGML